MDYKEKYEGLKKKAETLHKIASETSYDNTRMAIEELFPDNDNYYYNGSIGTFRGFPIQ